MTLNRRDFLSLSKSTALGLASANTLPACSTLEAGLNDQDIRQILGDYLHVGVDHLDLVNDFIGDLRYSTNTTEGLQETALILRGGRGRGEAERYVIQEFVRFSNYRFWLRRQDQTLGPSLVAEERDLLEVSYVNDQLAP
jgi:hypothetical protein